MSRLEKSREAKQKKKLKAKQLFIILAVILVLGTGSLLYGSMSGPTNQADMIDLDRTAAFKDVFGITHVRVYLHDGIEDNKLNAVIEGISMEYSPEDNMWDLSLDGYSAGEQLVIEVIAGDDGKVQEETIIIGD